MTVEKTVHKIDIYAFEYSFSWFQRQTSSLKPQANAENNYQSVHILMVIPI